MRVREAKDQTAATGHWHWQNDVQMLAARVLAEIPITDIRMTMNGSSTVFGVNISTEAPKRKEKKVLRSTIPSP